MMPPSPSLRATLLALGCPTVILDIYLFIFLECLAKLIMTDTLDTGWKTFYLIFLCILWQPGVKGCQRCQRPTPVGIRTRGISSQMLYKCETIRFVAMVMASG